jgi:predicted ester cyclase
VAVELPEGDRAVVDRDYETATDRIQALVPHFFQRVWNDRQVQLTELMWNPDVVFHSPLSEEPVRGREELLQYVDVILGAFSELHFSIDDVIAGGDRVVLQVTQTGVHTGDYFGIPATGRRARMSEIFVFRTSPVGPLGARIDEIWLSLNALNLMQQLGLFPKGDPPRPVLRAIIAFQRTGRKLLRRSA